LGIGAGAWAGAIGDGGDDPDSEGGGAAVAASAGVSVTPVVGLASVGGAPTTAGCSDPGVGTAISSGMEGAPSERAVAELDGAGAISAVVMMAGPGLDVAGSGDGFAIVDDSRIGAPVCKGFSTEFLTSAGVGRAGAMSDAPMNNPVRNPIGGKKNRTTVRASRLRCSRSVEGSSPGISQDSVLLFSHGTASGPLSASS